MNKLDDREEILVQVDEHDHVIGEVKRGEAHGQTKVIHRHVAILIYDDKQRILLQKRSADRRINPGVWSIGCAGHVKNGLAPEQAAHEELKEELGFDLALAFLEKKLKKAEEESFYVYYYSGKYSGEQIQLDLEEADEVHFFSEQELQQLIENGGKVNDTHLEIYKSFWHAYAD